MNKDINYCKETKQVIVKTINNEKICIFTFYGEGGRQQQEIDRHKQVIEFQQKVFSHFEIPINYIHNDFTCFDFGQALDMFTNATKDMVDYWIHFDIDAIPLKKDVINEIYEKIKDKKTLWGCASQSNHIIVNGTKQHAYCNTSTLGLSTSLWKKLGSPSFRNTARGDMGEELTWKTQELGYTLSLVYPSSFCGLTEQEVKDYQIGSPYSDLDNGFKFGMGTTYSDIIYHATMQVVPRSTTLFVQKCKEIISENIENQNSINPLEKEKLIKYLKSLPVSFIGGLGYDKGYGTDRKEIFNLRDSCINMIKDVFQRTNAKEVLEFGTHGGCSSTLMLALSNANVTSIDLCNGTGCIEWDYSYVDYGIPDSRPGMKEIVRLLNEWFPNRFRFIAGSSYHKDTVQKYNDRKYDLVFIDGDHTFDGCRADCLTAINLNIPWILVDDYTSSDTIREACNLPEFELVTIYKNIHSVLDIGVALFKNKNINV